MYIYIYIERERDVYVYMYVYIYIYIYIGELLGINAAPQSPQTPRSRIEQLKSAEVQTNCFDILKLMSKSP